MFQGAIETLRRHRPYLVFEHFVNAYRWYGMNSAELWRLLTEDCVYRISTSMETGLSGCRNFPKSPIREKNGISSRMIN